MDYLIVSILVAIIAIVYVWYRTRGTLTISDSQFIPLNTDDDKLLVHWYKLNMKQSYNFEFNDFSIATKYLLRNYQLDIKPDLIVVGTNLASQYSEITGNNLPKNNNNSSESDCVFDLRSTTGLPIEIAIIHNTRLKQDLRRNNSCDLTELNSIIESDLDIIAKNYIQEVLKFRWEKINKLNDSTILNINHNNTSYESYLYLPLPNTQSQSETITVLDSVSAFVTPQGARINLLCSNFEFEALIKRWTNYLKSPSITMII